MTILLSMPAAQDQQRRNAADGFQPYPDYSHARQQPAQSVPSVDNQEVVIAWVLDSLLCLETVLTMHSRVMGATGSGKSSVSFVFRDIVDITYKIG